MSAASRARSFGPRERAGYLLAGPALVVLGVFFALPVLAAFALSFTDFDIYALGGLEYLRFIGFDNYLALFRARAFWKALGNTLWFVILGVPLSLTASLGAALLLHACVAWLRGA